MSGAWAVRVVRQDLHVKSFNVAVIKDAAYIKGMPKKSDSGDSREAEICVDGHKKVNG